MCIICNESWQKKSAYFCSMKFKCIHFILSDFISAYKKTINVENRIYGFSFGY